MAENSAGCDGAGEPPPLVPIPYAPGSQITMQVDQALLTHNCIDNLGDSEPFDWVPLAPWVSSDVMTQAVDINHAHPQGNEILGDTKPQEHCIPSKDHPKRQCLLILDHLVTKKGANVFIGE